MTSTTGTHDTQPTDDPSCRILTVSTSLDTVISFVDQLCAMPNTWTTSPANGMSLGESPPPERYANESGLGERARIPWKIANKYYTADVHFLAHTVTGLSPNTLNDVPAVAFVWSRGEEYRQYVERLASDMRGSESEVCLAVRISSSASTNSTTGTVDEEDDTETDEFLSSNGFEFIDASSNEDVTSAVRQEEDLASSQGIPGLPRVHDALSTIMWPSMQARESGLGSSTRIRPDLDWVNNSIDGPSLVRGASRSKEEEMRELSRWLEEDDDAFSNDDPWRPFVGAASTEASQLPITSAPELGFEDDFTVFVSAPPEPDDDEDEDDSFDGGPRLGPPDSSPLYLSLGSGLDLSAVDSGGEQAQNRDDEEAGDLPTDAEIEEMHSLIFGSAVAGDDFEMAPFDLSKVMTALEGMKAEIANMGDEGSRRKAAAQVALGLVYGLEQAE